MIKTLIYLGQSIAAFYKRKFNLKIKPRFINFLLTYKCNARCLMCNIWDVYRKDPEKSKEELSLSDIGNFLIANKDFLSSVTHVGFTGGDPLLMRDDFVDIVKLFRKHLPEARLGVQTNGLIPELAGKKLQEITSFYPDFSLAVSLDGIGDTHGRIRGIDKAFELATLTINIARQLGIRRITCGMTLNQNNYKEIIQVKDETEKLGCEFSCFLSESGDYFNNKNLAGCQLSKEEESVVSEQLNSFARGNYFMDNLRLLLQRKRKPKTQCFSGFTSLVIDPYGNLKPCILKVKGIEDDVFGNIKKEALSLMLQSKKAKMIKEKIKKCNCWCQCEVSSSVVIFPRDVLWWFLFYCRDKKSFLSKASQARRRFVSG